jgi:cell division protein FtsB
VPFVTVSEVAVEKVMKFVQSVGTACLMLVATSCGQTSAVNEQSAAAQAAQTEKLQADIALAKAETTKAQAEAERFKAEAAKTSAETDKLQDEARIRKAGKQAAEESQASADKKAANFRSTLTFD